VRLSSGARKTIVGDARAMIGIVGGGGRTDKPILKAGISYYKHKVTLFKFSSKLLKKINFPNFLLK
jgi:large subunit ribosomal protein L8e